MRRRTASRRSSPLRWFLWAGGLALLLAVLLILALPMLVRGYLRGFVRGDSFPKVIENSFESRLGGQMTLSPLIWQEDSATFSDLDAETASGWQIAARSGRVAVDFGAIRRGVWHLHSASVDELSLTRLPLETSAIQNLSAAFTGIQLPSWVRRYVPSQTEVDGLDCERFSYKHGNWFIEGTRLHLDFWRGDAGDAHFSIPAVLESGTLQTPLSLPNQATPLKLDLTRASLRLSEDRVQLTEATLRWKDRSQATLSGSRRTGDGQWQAELDARQVPMSEFLEEAWKSRLSGEIEGRMTLSSNAQKPMSWQADVALKKAVLSGLPLLEKLATYTRMERFKNLAFDTATATVLPQENGATRLEKIVLQCNGLLRIEGGLTVSASGALDGDFMLGVTPEALRWIPGAESRIFTLQHLSGPPGLNWTRVQVAGTLQAPQEDLSNRLIGAAGMSLLLDTPTAVINKAADTLLKPVLGNEGAKLPGKVIEEGVKTGTELLNQVVPLFGK